MNFKLSPMAGFAIIAGLTLSACSSTNSSQMQKEPAINARVLFCITTRTESVSMRIAIVAKAMEWRNQGMDISTLRIA